MFVSDVLCGIEEIQEELHPSFYSNQLVLLVVAMVSNETCLHLPLHQPTLRLRSDGHHSSKLRLPGDDRDRRRSRVSNILIRQNNDQLQVKKSDFLVHSNER